MVKSVLKFDYTKNKWFEGHQHYNLLFKISRISIQFKFVINILSNELRIIYYKIILLDNSIQFKIK